MREALVKAAVFWLQVLSGLKWAAGRAGSNGVVSFCGNKTGCRKAQSEGYGSVLERARSTCVAAICKPLRGPRFRAACGASGDAAVAAASA